MCFFLPVLQMILCKTAQFKYLFSTSYAFLSIYEQSVLFYSLLYIFCSLFFRHCLSYIIHWYIIHRRMIFCLFLHPRLRLLIESLLARNRIQMFLPFLSRYIMNCHPISPFMLRVSALQTASFVKAVCRILSRFLWNIFIYMNYCSYVHYMNVTGKCQEIFVGI